MRITTACDPQFRDVNSYDQPTVPLILDIQRGLRRDGVLVSIINYKFELHIISVIL